MQAYVFHSYGNPEEVLKIETIPIPIISDDEVLIQVRAISINPTDWKRMLGFYKLLGSTMSKLPAIPSSDFAGIVTEVGKSVMRLKVGDEVYGKTTQPVYTIYFSK
jgi:2-methylene-furan-3-one reductase